MLRHYDQHGGGVKVYTREILRGMFELNRGHEFVLLFNDPRLVGSFRNHVNVTEVVVRGKSVPYWDQIGTPLAVRKYGIDVLYNPKYSIPLAVSCPTAWVCHGLDWYVIPEASRWIDRLSHKFLVPRYAHKADAIICVSEITRQQVMHYLDVPGERVHTVYSGVSPDFSAPISDEMRVAARKTFALPPRYFLFVGSIYPPKNFTRLVRAYAKVGPQRGIHLVIAGGENRFLSEHELQEPERLGIESWVHRLGWIESPNLPVLYNMAEALLLPSLFESFGLPIVEAMSAGCPVVTSNTFGSKEIGADAAIQVDPSSVDAIAAGIVESVENLPLRARLISAGTERAQLFSWRKCAAETLNVLETMAPKK
jgi:glycosyltransferase involved in cell wall biosynthesis